MLILTTDLLPKNLEVTNIFSMVEATSRIQVNHKGLIKGFMDRNKDEHQEAYDRLIASAPKGANAIIGVKTSTSVQQFTDGTFLFITYIGTPATIEEINFQK